MKTMITLLSSAVLFITTIAFGQAHRDSRIADTARLCNVESMSFSFPRAFTVNANSRRNIGSVEGLGFCSVSNAESDVNVTIVPGRTYIARDINCATDLKYIQFSMSRDLNLTNSTISLYFYCRHENHPNISVREFRNLMGGIGELRGTLRRPVRDVELKSGSSADAPSGDNTTKNAD